ncbi:CBS domain-containing protein [Chryseosolibacter indicus]|uniref:CBS domain-containing protein n=1 Tax=Chryseosolibacter indicus TaxID=2782351 RepID=A0ABS5VW57_9BACT|nr:CBS domain-containing protein [Chryseosolibacter indicus]MBT1705672.1 CBS domain-containing protein [Chryseosolibacter indicus]
MKKVADILNAKGSNVISVSPDTTVIDALRIMAIRNIGSVMVMDGQVYCGLLTERDYARKVILKGKTSAETPVEEIMSNDLPHINRETSIESCMELMSDNNLRYLPVFDRDRVIGIISINDVIKAVISNQQETITHLENYINS